MVVGICTGEFVTSSLKLAGAGVSILGEPGRRLGELAGHGARVLGLHRSQPRWVGRVIVPLVKTPGWYASISIVADLSRLRFVRRALAAPLHSALTVA